VTDRPGSTGILGGTFDPIHFGHLAIAEEAREALGLERVLFVPTSVPPHKLGRAVAPAAHRAAMVELAIAPNPAFQLSRSELDRPGPSYAVETLELLVAEAKGVGRPAEFTFILAADAFAGFLDWREPSRLLELARLAVVPRPGHHPPGRSWLKDHFPGQEDRVTFLDGPHIGLSATEIRDRAAHGRSVRYFVPDAVAAYIKEHSLYTEPDRRTD
jgi:nicotinate-nucleotide adenylyltransferase